MKQILLLGVKSLQKPRFLAVDYENVIEINSDTQLNTMFEGILTSSIFSCAIYFKNIWICQNVLFFSVSITVCNKYSCESRFYKYTSKKKNISVNWTLHQICESNYPLSNKIYRRYSSPRSGNFLNIDTRLILFFTTNSYQFKKVLFFYFNA